MITKLTPRQIKAIDATKLLYSAQLHDMSRMYRKMADEAQKANDTEKYWLCLGKASVINDMINFNMEFSASDVANWLKEG